MQAIDHKKYGPWALITGASYGIGEEFARQLAANGLNVVLVSRRKQMLDNVANELESQYAIKAKTVAVDLSQPEAIDIIDEGTREIEIGLLVNNAAMIVAGALVKTEVTDQMQVIHTNIVAPVQLAHLFGRKMSQRGQGGIIFVSSMGGYTSMPYMANYMATKAYLVSLGEALNYELKQQGVDVTVLCPGGTKTINTIPAGVALVHKGVDWAEAAKSSAMEMAVTPVVATALKALGKKPAVIPGVMNNVMVFILTRFSTRKFITSIFAKMGRKAVLKELL